MGNEAPAAFFSYSRVDSNFTLKLAQDLKTAGANVWLDQLDIGPGDDWPMAVEKAMRESPCMLVILSPTSVASNQVRAEYHYALEKQKKIIPVLYQDCEVPFHLGLLQRVDLRVDYDRGLQGLINALRVDQTMGRPIAEQEKSVRATAAKETPQTRLQPRKIGSEQTPQKEARRKTEAERSPQEPEVLKRAEPERKALNAEGTRQKAETGARERAAQKKAEEEDKAASQRRARKAAAQRKAEEAAAQKQAEEEAAVRRRAKEAAAQRKAAEAAAQKQREEEAAAQRRAKEAAAQKKIVPPSPQADVRSVSFWLKIAALASLGNLISLMSGILLLVAADLFPNQWFKNFLAELFVTVGVASGAEEVVSKLGLPRYAALLCCPGYLFGFIGWQRIYHYNVQLSSAHAVLSTAVILALVFRGTLRET